ncbi:PREDICTED: IQ and ubiquitin-like domain-containing protein [Amphimedon queenslandica]|uniref:Protein-tyrosine-phosphatase n=2 Tax=Amphimedon queenslandica TaxID=400682 RepID=A0AAN0J1Q4_AMPQE|nr:PREDICTED: IQ and ubiquitin-like domain-containing protein [Amphimedon queenslandica]|eukprot:XP_019850672.1 PREDICTED: IQ and ubiquitin-like domain-containing protein [Amphimedon queenslandica]
MATVEASVPSAEPQEEGESTEDKVEVVFAIENSSEDVKDLFSLSDSVQKLKEYLSQKFGNSSDTFILSLDGETLSNNATVDQFGVVGGSSIELQVKILTPLALPVSKEEEEEEKLKKEKEREEEELGYDERIFTVQVRLAQEMKELLVKMEKARIKKPFLGGYRDKQTGQEYHHASAQTLPRRKPDTGIAMFERDTQTVFTRNCYQQVMVDAATQMNQTGCYITSVTDKIKIPGPYETADEYHGKILKKIIILQSHWRRWLATKYVNAVREEKLMRELWEREEALRKQREREARRKAEFERRMNPRTKKDFDLLYHALENWPQDGVVREPHTVLQVIDDVIHRQQKIGGGPVVVHCSDTVSRSGVYCSVSIGLEQCKAEGVVDVFQVTKAVRRSKPGAVTTLEQYTSIYDVIDTYLQMNETYGNFQF